MSLPKKDVQKLKELRKLLSLETAGFDAIHGGDPPLPRSEADVNAFIRERTRLWRQSWVFPLIDELIAKHDRTVSKNGKR